MLRRKRRTGCRRSDTPITLAPPAAACNRSRGGRPASARRSDAFLLLLRRALCRLRSLARACRRGLRLAGASLLRAALARAARLRGALAGGLGGALARALLGARLLGAALRPLARFRARGLGRGGAALGSRLRCGSIRIAHGFTCCFFHPGDGGLSGFRHTLGSARDQVFCHFTLSSMFDAITSRHVGKLADSRFFLSSSFACETWRWPSFPLRMIRASTCDTVGAHRIRARRGSFANQR